MSEDTVKKILDTIYLMKTENIYTGLGGFSDAEIERLHSARTSAFELSETYIKHFALLERIENLKTDMS